METENDVFGEQKKPEDDVFGKQLAVKKRTSIWKVLGIMVLGMGVAAGAYLKFAPGGQDLIPTIKAIGRAQANPNLIFDNAGGDHVNILLIGRDVNWKPAKVMGRPFHVADKDTTARSDTMIVISLNKTNNTIRMVSLPRDAMVRMPENKYNVHRAKLNAAHAYGGPEMLIKTLHDELGLTIHDYAVIKFEGFKKLIDQVGGVTVNVDGALKRHNGKLYRGNMDYDDNWGNLHIHLKPGVQRLDGQKAHDYVRFRMDLEGDPGRIRRQQQVMRSLAKEIMHQSPWKIPGLVKEVRRQFETSLQEDEIASAAMFAKNLGDSQKIQPLTLFGVFTHRGSLILNKDKNTKLLQTIFGSSFNADAFLANSPSTEGDEIGITNNRSPEARAVLREAGLTEEAEAKDNAETSAPVATQHEERQRETRAERRRRRKREAAEARLSANSASKSSSNRSQSSASNSSAEESSSSVESSSESSPEPVSTQETHELSVESSSETPSSPSESSSEESPVPQPE